MTGREAAQILEKPIFGHPVCLDAIEVLRLAEQLLEARQWAKRRNLFAPAMRIDAVAFMEHEDVAEELNYWHECGYRREQ